MVTRTFTRLALAATLSLGALPALAAGDIVIGLDANIVGLDSPATASKDLAALLRTVAADLVLTYSPEDKDLAESWRLPVAKKGG